MFDLIGLAFYFSQPAWVYQLFDADKLLKDAIAGLFFVVVGHIEGPDIACQVDWAELYCLQYGVDPGRVGQAIGRNDLFDTSWVYDPRVRCFHPNYRCSCSGNPLVIFNMTPVNAERVLREAGRNGILSDIQQGIIRTISPVVKQLSGARSGVPAQQVQQAYRQGVPQARPGQPMQGPVPMQGYPNGVPAYYPQGYNPGGQRRG